MDVVETVFIGCELTVVEAGDVFTEVHHTILSTFVFFGIFYNEKLKYKMKEYLVWSGPGCSLPVFIEHFCSAVLCWVGVSPETQPCPPGSAVGIAGTDPVIP